MKSWKNTAPTAWDWIMMKAHAQKRKHMLPSSLLLTSLNLQQIWGGRYSLIETCLTDARTDLTTQELVETMSPLEDHLSQETMHSTEIGYTKRESPRHTQTLALTTCVKLQRTNQNKDQLPPNGSTQGEDWPLLTQVNETIPMPDRLLLITHPSQLT